MTIPATPPEQTEVVVVGAGPTGLTAAIKLAQLGIPHIVLDAARRRPRRPRRRSSTPRAWNCCPNSAWPPSSSRPAK